MTTLPAIVGPNALAILNIDEKALIAGRLALERDTAEMRALVIDDPDTAEAVGSVLIARLREYDIAKETREKYTGPAHKTWKNLCELFDVKPHEALITAIKGALGAWQKRVEVARLEAEQVARAALVAGDVQALTTSLQTFNAPEQKAEGVGSRKVWKVKRYNTAMMIPSSDALPGLVPDASAIAAFARAHRGEDPPVIPGVIFEQEIEIFGRRK